MGQFTPCGATSQPDGHYTCGRAAGHDGDHVNDPCGAGVCYGWPQDAVVAPFFETGRQIYVAYDWMWDEFAKFADQRGWALCLIPSDPNAPDHDGIPTYCLQPKEIAS